MRLRALPLVLLVSFAAACTPDLPTAAPPPGAAFAILEPDPGPGFFEADRNRNGAVCVKGLEQEPVPVSAGEGGGPLVVIDDRPNAPEPCPPGFQLFRTRGGPDLAGFDRNGNGVVCVRGGETEPVPVALGTEPGGRIVIIDDSPAGCPPPFRPVRIGRGEFEPLADRNANGAVCIKADESEVGVAAMEPGPGPDRFLVIDDHPNAPEPCPPGFQLVRVRRPEPF